MGFTKQLLEVGLTRREADIYKLLLTIGAQPVSVISKRISINRSTIYSVLKSLKDKGIIASFIKEGIEMFLVGNNKSIISYIDRKVQALDYYRCEVIKELPKMKVRSELYSTQKPLVQHYDGMHGVSEVLNDALSANDLLLFSPVNEWENGLVSEFLLKYMSYRSKTASVRIITRKTKKSSEFFSRNFRRNEQINVKFLPENDKMGCSSIENSVKIYNNRVSMVNIDKDLSHGVIIESEGISQMHRHLFETLWKNIK